MFNLDVVKHCLEIGTLSLNCGTHYCYEEDNLYLYELFKKNNINANY